MRVASLGSTATPDKPHWLRSVSGVCSEGAETQTSRAVLGAAVRRRGLRGAQGRRLLMAMSPVGATIFQTRPNR